MHNFETTAEYLKEITGTTAAEIVTTVRRITDPFGPTFIPQLDERLVSSRPHPAGAVLNRGELIEVVGPTGSGKTTLLTFFLLTTLLPPTFILDNLQVPITIETGGRGRHAALLQPVTHKSLIPRLAEGIQAHLIACIQSQAENVRMIPSVYQQIDDLVVKSLANLRVIRVKPRYRYWVLALQSLLSSMKHGPRTPSDTEEQSLRDSLDLVVCDGFADGFWPERLNDEEKSAGNRRGIESMTGIRGANDVGMKDVMEAIGELRKGLGAVVLLSNQALWSNPGSSFYSAHLPHPFPAPWSESRGNNIPSQQLYSYDHINPSFWPLDIQITLTGRIRSLQLPSDLTLVDVMRTKHITRSNGSHPDEEGHNVIAWRHRESQKFEGYLRLDAEATNPRGGGRFEFQIGEEGLEAGD